MTGLLNILGQYWGYHAFRPLQQEAMEAILAGRDSVVVLPTGGGKSLCFQAPALVRDGLAIVVSPLISLMKDQVDSLQEIGVSCKELESLVTSALQAGALGAKLSGGGRRDFWTTEPFYFRLSTVNFRLYL